MKVAQINLTYQIGSTGKIVSDIDSTLRKAGHESIIICGYSNKRKDNVFSLQTFPTAIDIRKDILISRISGTMGYRSKRETAKAIEVLDDFKPEIVHLHNIHGDYINIFMLFKYLARKHIPIIWTLHDCWSFTGRCSHFELDKCDQWKNGCVRCDKFQKRIYPITYFFDFSKKMWIDKNNTFNMIDRMTIVTPSQWLANYIPQSYLNRYSVRVINNGINLEKNRIVDFARINNKKIILGVASSWTERKGLFDLLKLNDMLDHDFFQLCLVGLNERQYSELPENIIKYKRTNSVDELNRLYSSALLLINPTYQDNYPTVNLEAIACGTKVVTYNTGGSPESINHITGFVVDKGDINAIYSIILKVAEHGYNKEELREYAVNNFDINQKYRQYIDLYEEFLK